MSELSAITVVIANWGTPDLTIRSATAVIEDGVPAERVVVVDNGSEDDSYTRFQAELASCRLVRLEENIGFARASNRGARELPGDAYLFVNNDAFVELVRASGASRFLPNRVQPSWSTHWDHGEAREIQAVNGAVLLVRGRTWDELGGFEEQAHMYAEDLDVCWRARSAGWKVWFTPDAEFVHLGNAASGRHWSNPERAAMVGRSEAEMIRRHMSRPSAALTVGLISAGLAGRWLVYRAMGNREAATSLSGGLRGYLGRN